MKFSAVTCGSAHRMDNVFAMACVARGYRVSCNDIPKSIVQIRLEENNINVITRSHLGMIVV